MGRKDPYASSVFGTQDDFDRMYQEAQEQIDKEWADGLQRSAAFHAEVEEDLRTQRLQQKLQHAINDAVFKQQRRG
jgi:hypothetical protein